MTVRVDEHGLTVQAARPAVCYNITIGAGSVQSPAFQAKNPTPYPSDGTTILGNQNTNHIRVCATIGCWLAFGTNPTALYGGATSIFIAPLTPEYFWVYPGERIAVTQDSGGGILNVAELVS